VAKPALFRRSNTRIALPASHHLWRRRMSSDSTSSDRRPPANLGEDLQRIGKYEIVRRLGVGGMGTVYLAVDSDLKRTVALKVLPRDRASNPTLVRRFKSEGQAAALLHHKHIVSVYEAGQADGYLFLALEYVDGVDLLEWVQKRGPIPIKRSVEIMRQTAAALQHAYERNIVHRDIKPSNLMISRDGTVKLTDMGLARSIDETLDTTITRDGTTVGTVDYMAPEQASNSKAADIRSDIYSLGCTWYHLLTGSPPYAQGSITNKIASHISGPIPDPRLINPKVPEAVVAVIHRMMAKKKDQRYQTPAELIDDLNTDTLKRSNQTNDLLAMLGEDVLDSSGEMITAAPGETRQAVSSGSSGFTVGTNRRPAARNAPGRTRECPPAATASVTRTELTTAADPREKLARRSPTTASSSPTPIPWSLIILGILVAVIGGGVFWLVTHYAESTAVRETISPYAVGREPDEIEKVDSHSETAPAAAVPAVKNLQDGSSPIANPPPPPPQ
jgi:serine/threonine-protein kinase